MPRRFTDRLAARAADVAERAREAGERARDAVHDVVSDPEVIDLASTGIRRVGAPVLRWGPVEWLLPAAGVAAIIKLADRQGLLESETARPLKEIAEMVDNQVAMDQQRILNAIPKIIELKLVSKVMGEGKAREGVMLLARMAASSDNVKELVEKFLAARGQQPPSHGGLS